MWFAAMMSVTTGRRWLWKSGVSRVAIILTRSLVILSYKDELQRTLCDSTSKMMVSQRLTLIFYCSTRSPPAAVNLTPLTVRIQMWSLLSGMPNRHLPSVNGTRARQPIQSFYCRKLVWITFLTLRDWYEPCTSTWVVLLDFYLL